MADSPIIVVDVIGEVVAAVQAAIGATLPSPNKVILYTYGRSIQILEKLTLLNNSKDLKGTKYPLFALFMDFPENHGGNNGYPFTVKFPKISIATLTNSTDDPPKRYNATFKPILYPIYQEFLRQLVRHKNIVGNDPNTISHIKWDRPGSQPEGSGLNDYIDAIELQNLELTFKKVKTC